MRKQNVVGITRCFWGLFLLALSLAILFIGIVCYTKFTRISKVNSTTSSEKAVRTNEFVPLKTTLHGGDIAKTIQLDLAQQIQNLATGTVPDDMIAWGFKNALLYTESPNKRIAEESMSHYVIYSLNLGRQLFPYGKTGIYDVRSLSYTTEAREVSDANGGIFYRCAVTGVSVKSWCSPYGETCSREEALEYYNKCSAQINSVVSQVVAARSSDGEPLSDAKKLKWVHDWLIKNADYAYDSSGAIRNEHGALVDGEAVCRGYTYAFKAIVDELARQTGADIECEEVTTRTHSWVRVKLDGEWYNIDVTWDECNSLPEYISEKYFLVSDDAISDDAHQNHSSVSSVKATNKQYEGRDWRNP